jgi:predicted aminopeptidase
LSVTKHGIIRILLLVILSCSGCDLTYLFHAAAGQFRLLNDSIPIQKALNDQSLPPDEQERLRLVARIKSFGEKELGLKETDNYETVYLSSSQRPVYTVSASPRDRLCQKTWWFPFIGDIPYLGFFDLEKAKAEGEQLTSRHLDVFIGVADAYSTLGWFQDPVTLNLIRGSTPDLAEILLHEMTHTTLYLKGQSAFNEGLAVLVGKVGAFLFFDHAFGPLHPFTRKAKASIDDERLFSRFLDALMDELECLYGSPLSYGEKLTQREVIFTRSLKSFRSLSTMFKTDRFARFSQRPLNNASILALGLYHRHFDLFEAVLEAKGGSIREVLSFFEGLSKESDDLLKDTEVWLQNCSTPHT